MFTVFLALGSNIGERKKYLGSALTKLKEIIAVRNISSVYETEPVGIDNAGSFLNVVVEGETELLPPALLVKIKGIESSLGRSPETHMKSREIDIDIELYNGYIYRDETVEVPHPELLNRKFILAPFSEIAPDILHPLNKKSIGELLKECPDTHNIVRTNISLTD